MKKILAFVLAVTMLLGMTACGAAQEKVDLRALYETCLQDMTPMMEVEGDTRMDFMGVDENDCLQVITAFAEDGLLTDELWLIEAKDQKAMERLKALAESRMQAKKDETVTYSPEQYAVVEKGVILEKGLYLALIVCPNVETVRSAVEAAIQG